MHRNITVPFVLKSIGGAIFQRTLTIRRVSINMMRSDRVSNHMLGLPAISNIAEQSVSDRFVFFVNMHYNLVLKTRFCLKMPTFIETLLCYNISCHVITLKTRFRNG